MTPFFNLFTERPSYIKNEFGMSLPRTWWGM